MRKKEILHSDKKKEKIFEAEATFVPKISLSNKKSR
jgi:hypothetical protein